MNENKAADVLIIARGGGSLEDLWPFNEECVAYAIYHSEIPVISAVGHETDFSISDFVADLRAPTPSAAAELAVPDLYEIQRKIAMLQERLRLALNKKLEIMRLRLEKCMSSRVFKEPTRHIQDLYLRVESNRRQLENRIKEVYNKNQTDFMELVAKLDALSPLKTLTRGYSIIEKEGKMIRSIQELHTGDIATLKLKDGIKQAKIQ